MGRVPMSNVEYAESVFDETSGFNKAALPSTSNNKRI